MPTLTSPHDLITAVPFLIGFHPTDSIVLISLKEGAIGLAMRIDLPAHLDADAIDLLAHHFICDGAEGALLLAYMPNEREDGDSLLISLGAGLIRNGVEVQESLLIRNGRYRSIICRDLTCCSPAGKALPDINDSQIAAEHVVAGIQMPYANIQELIETLAPAQSSFDSQWADQVNSFFVAEDAEAIGELRRDGTRNDVASAAGGERHDEAHGLGGVSLGKNEARAAGQKHAADRAGDETRAGGASCEYACANGRGWDAHRTPPGWRGATQRIAWMQNQCCGANTP